MAKSERRKLESKLDKVFSELVRRSRADENGYVECYTCGVKKHWKRGMHAGHFISRRNRAVRWDYRHCRPQCAGCNTFGKLHGPGEPVIFRQKLQGEGVDVEALERLARKGRHWLLPELEEMLHEYDSYLADMPELPAPV